MHNPDIEWYTASSLDEYKSLTKEFLRGQLKSTLWHYGPLEDESKTLVSDLQFINTLGLIPTNSQPGVFWNPLHRLQQRAYIEGFTTLEKADRIAQKAQKYSLTVHTKQNSNLATDIYRTPITRSRPGRTYSYGPKDSVQSTLYGLQKKSFMSESWAVLESAVTVSIMDLNWGSNRMWKHVIEILKD